MGWLQRYLSLLQCASNSSDDFCCNLGFSRYSNDWLDQVPLFLLQTGDLASEYQETKMWELYLGAVSLVEGKCSCGAGGD